MGLAGPGLAEAPAMTTRLHLRTALAAVLLSTACGVSQQKYDASLQDAATARTQAKACASDVEKLRKELAGAQAIIGDREKALAEAARQAQYQDARLDGLMAETFELRNELTRLGKNADALLAEKGALSGALAETKRRLEELRRAHAAAEARAVLFRQLALKFQSMIDAGSLAITLRDGRMVLQLPNDVLFDSGQTAIKPDGRKALSQVGTVLGSFPGRRFQVAGNTDNVPIQTARFPSNWELSTARAVEVVRFLISRGMHPDLLSATGYGEFDPVAANDTDLGRTKNRRIEIVLQPNIDEFVSVPGAR